MNVSTLTVAVVVLAAFVAVSAVDAQRNRACCEDYCFDTDKEQPQVKRLGTKTAYQVIRGSQSIRQFYVPNCAPVKFWLLSRHGTRLPDASKIKSMRELGSFRDEIIKNYEERHTKPDEGYLCDEDIELLKNWRWQANITEDRGGALTGQGWNDMKELAQNYQSAFPRLLENIYTPAKFQFKHTDVERTNTSLKAFLEGLFGDRAYDHIWTPQQLDDGKLLKPYDQCKAWERNADWNKDNDDSEVNKFEEGQVYQQMLDEVSKRLGFKLTLSKKQVKLIYDMCRYDQAWSLDRSGAWCTAFTKSQINVLEYAQDLKYYRETGYGNAELNANVACETVKDMLRQLDNKENPMVSAYFAHSSTVQLFLTALNTFRDAVPLRADNYDQMARRKWRVSEISPFAANVAAIKYDCPNDNDRTKVMFFLNQKPMDFPFCNVGLCSWADVKRMLSRFDGANCGQIFCRATGGAAKVKTSTGVGAMTLAVLSIIGQYF